MSRRYAILSLLLILLSSLSSSVGAQNEYRGIDLYTFDQSADSVTATVNFTGNVEYDLAIVSTNNYQKLMQGVRSLTQLQNYSFILAFAATNGSDSLTYQGDLRGLYLIVYSPDILFNGSDASSYSLSGSSFESAEFTLFGDHPLEYLHGNSVPVTDNETTRYVTYSINVPANTIAEMFITSSDSDFMVFIEDNRSRIDTPLVANLVSNFSNFVSEGFPAYIADFGVFTGSGGYMQYNASDATTINIIFVFFNSYSGDNQTYYYFATSIRTTGDSSFSWYNAWFADLVRDNPITRPPYAPILLILISMFTSLLSAFVTRKLVDLEELNKFQKIINKHNKLKNKARDTADKQLWAKVQAKDKRITELQQKIMMKRMLPQLFLTLPFIAIFTTLRGTIGNSYLNLTPNRGAVVAVLPFWIPEWFPLIGGWFSRFVAIPEISAAGFGFMYFLSAIVSSTLIQRIFGINLQGTRPENPFKQ